MIQERLKVIVGHVSEDRKKESFEALSSRRNDFKGKGENFKNLSVLCSLIFYLVGGILPVACS